MIEPTPDTFPPTVVRDLPGDDYHAEPGWSSSQLKSMAISPLHFYRMHLDPDRPEREEKPQFTFGTLVHTLVLEPDKYSEQFVIEPPFNKRTKAGKEEYQHWLDGLTGQKVISASDLDVAHAMRDAVLNHEAAHVLLNSLGIEMELSGWWRDDRTGQLLKYRADARTDRALIDLKTTAGPVDYDTVQRAIWNFNYHTSAAHYLDGDRNCFDIDHDTFILIFVSKQWPHEVGVYYLDADAMELGRRQNRTWLNQLNHCLSENLWPPVNDGRITEIGLPKYAINKLGA